MKIEFVKMHGLGNDFVFIEDLGDELDLSAEQVERLCDRHFGIGADGVIVVKPADDASCDARMHYINADGTLAQMCGNGVRCFAKYLVDRRNVDPAAHSLCAQTLAGPREIGFEIDEAGCMTSATVDMGAPIIDPSLVPTRLEANARTDRGNPFVREALADSPWGAFRFTCVSMGNPHAVCFIDDFSALPGDLFLNADDRRLATLDLARVGAFFESNALWPEKTNVEFAVVSPDGRHIDMRVFERGCGETLACGTGACATAVAGALTDRVPRETDVALLGGTLHIRWSDSGHVFMTGPAAEAFRGTVDVP